MKKLIIAACLIVTAVASNAAQVSWKAQATKADASAGNGLEIYMVLATDWNDQGWASAKDLIDASVGQSATFTVGAKSASSTSAIYQSASTSVGDTVDYYLAMIDTANNRYYASDLITSSAATADGVNDKDAGGALLPAVNPTLDTWQIGSGLKTPGNWTTFAAPEPTSGLLLLLGMGALALRRRRT